MAATVSWDGLRELASFRAEKGCAISVYVDLDPSVAPTAGDAASRVNSLMHEGEVRAEAAHELTHEQREALRRDLARIREFFQRDFSRQFRRLFRFALSGEEPDDQADQAKSNKARQKNHPGRDKRVINWRRDLVKLLLSKEDRCGSAVLPFPARPARRPW